MSAKFRLAPLAAGVAATVLALAGCGSSGGGASTSGSSGSSSQSGGGPSVSAKKDPKVAALVPAAVRRRGTITVATDPSYAPNEFIASDGHTIQGMDVDLVKALAAVMGLKAAVVNSTFDSIIPGLAAKKYDLSMSSFTDTKERQKTVDFVTYFSSGTSFYTKAQGGPAVNGLSDVCGHKVAVEKGTTQATDAQAQAKKCRAAGKPAVTALVFPDQNGANLALSSGRADIVMADSPVADYAVKQSNGQFKIVGKTYGTAPYGVAVPKGSAMTKPVRAALKVLMADGTYKRILAKWGVQSGAISNPTINGATS